MIYSLKTIGFEPDLFQKQSFDFLDRGFSVLVSAATGSGKTLIAEFGISKYLNLNKSVVYTTPIKALSNQKFEELAGLFGADDVGIVTGDVNINPEAKLVVMTTEVLRNQLYSGNVSPSLGLVVLDEIHFIKDRFRGGTWEEIVINLSKKIPIVCLSATISNEIELGRWISSVHGDTFIIKSTHRPVPLSSGLYYVSPDSNYRLENINLDLKKSFKRVAKLERAIVDKSSTRILRPNRFEIVDFLNENNRLPAIYFIFSRVGCDSAVSDYIKFGVPLLNRNDQKTVEAFVESALSRISKKDQVALRIDMLLRGLKLGVASHHSGVVPPVKQIIEKLFAKGLLKVVFATETLSTGINMPARSVVIDSYVKRDDFGIRQLDSFEFTQMAGRAGRRGMDEVGWVILPVDHKTAPTSLFDIAANKEYIVTSNFRATYNTVLNLLNRFDRNHALEFLNKTFARYQNRTELGREFMQREKVLESLGYIDAGAVTQTGFELRNLYSECDLLLHLFFSRYEFESLDIESLTAVLAACIFEKRNHNRVSAKKAKDNFYLAISRNTKIEKALYFLETTFYDIDAIEAKYGFFPTKEPDPMFVGSAIDWIRQGSLETIVNNGFLSAGELIKNFRSMIDLANQLTAAFKNRFDTAIFKDVTALLDRELVTLSGNLINNTTSI